MKTNFLFPNHFKKVGWIMLVPSALLGILYIVSGNEPDFMELPTLAIVNSEIFSGNEYFAILRNNLYGELIAILLLFSLVFIAFSKEKIEDEFYAKIRLESLLWATYATHAVLIFALAFIYGMAFYWVLVLNMFTLLSIFIIRFHWAKNRL